MRRICIEAAVILLSVYLTPVKAGVEMLDGRESKIWAKGAAYLIVARVTKVLALDGKEDDATHLITLDPIFTVAGEFDPATHPQVEARLYVVPNSDVWVPVAPSKDSILLALIIEGSIGGDANRPFPWVSPDICLFMPDRRGLITLHDLNDKRITETLERIREARAEAKSATRPANDKPPPEDK
jgi:hypothetical protein